AAETIARGEDDVAEAGVERDRDRRRAEREERVAGQDDLSNFRDTAELRAVAALIAEQEPVRPEGEGQVLARDGAVAQAEIAAFRAADREARRLDANAFARVGAVSDLERRRANADRRHRGSGEGLRLRVGHLRLFRIPDEAALGNRRAPARPPRARSRRSRRR